MFIRVAQSQTFTIEKWGDAAPTLFGLISVKVFMGPFFLALKSVCVLVCVCECVCVCVCVCV